MVKSSKNNRRVINSFQIVRQNSLKIRSQNYQSVPHYFLKQRSASPSKFAGLLADLDNDLDDEAISIPPITPVS